MAKHFAQWALVTLVPACMPGCASTVDHPSGLATLIVTRSQNDHNVLAIKVANRSNIPLCFDQDLISNQDTVEPLIELRYNGYKLRRRPTGYLIPIKPGAFTLDPQVEKTLYLNMSHRFDVPMAQLSRKGKWEARVAIRVLPCDATTIGQSFLVTSDWTSLESR